MASVSLPAPKQVAYRPVTWALQSDGAVGAEMARGDEPKLVVYAESGASGGVASKLMFLAPGRYRLSWRTVNEASDETGPTNMLGGRSEEHTYELQSLMRHSYDVFCVKKQNTTPTD